MGDLARPPRRRPHTALRHISGAPLADASGCSLPVAAGPHGFRISSETRISPMATAAPRGQIPQVPSNPE